MRKMRWALPGGGKSGGIRVLYFYREERGRVYLLAAYAKNRKETISAAEKAIIRQRVRTLKVEE